MDLTFLTVLQVFFAAVVAATTIAYALFTRTLARETARLREAQTEPEIVVYLEEREYAPYLMNIVVKNVGAGTAYNLRWTFDRHSPLIKERANILKQLRFFEGVSYFAPGQRYTSFLASTHDLIRKPIPPALSMQVDFDNRDGKHYTREYLIDPIQLFGRAWVSDQPLKDIAQNVERIHEDLKRMGSSLRRFKVDVFDSADRAEERQQEADRPASTDQLQEPLAEETSQTGRPIQDQNTNHLGFPPRCMIDPVTGPRTKVEGE